MKLITQKFELLFKNYPLYSQDGIKDPLVIAKFFVWNITWYLTAYDTETKNAFGYVTGLQEDEFWYISVLELENTKINNIWEVERDLFFRATSLKSLVSEKENL
jgi:hypothetical protein